MPSSVGRKQRKDRLGPETSKLDPTDIRKVIYTLDAYRAHLFYDMTWIDAKVERGTLGRNFAARWKELRHMMVKMAHLPASLPTVPGLVRLQGYFEAMWQIAGPLVFILLFASLLAPQIPLIASIAPYIMIAGLVMLLIGLLARFLVGREIGRRIEEHFAKNPELHKPQAKQLWEAVQLLIEELRRLVRESGDDPKKHLVGVTFLDYEHIQVSKKPQPWRRYCLVVVTI